MGLVKITKYSCDRCDVVMEEKPRNYPELTIKVSIQEEWSGYSLEYTDLCPKCHSELHKPLLELLRAKRDTPQGI